MGPRRGQRGGGWGRGRGPGRMGGPKAAGPTHRCRLRGLLGPSPFRAEPFFILRLSFATEPFPENRLRGWSFPPR